MTALKSRSMNGYSLLLIARRENRKSPIKTLLPMVVLMAAAQIVTSPQFAAAQGLSGVPQRLREKKPVSFSKQVAGLLSTHCGKCHVRSAKGNFRMATFSELMRAKGMVQSGNPAQSKLYDVISSGEMPPKNPMPQEDEDVIKRWIEQGAKFDGSNENATLTSMAGASGAPAAGGGPPAGRGGPPNEANMSGYSMGPPPGEGPPGSGGDGGYGDEGDGGYGGYDDGGDGGYDDGGDGGYGGYDDGGYGGGGGSSRSRGRATGTAGADAIETYGSTLTAMLGSMDLSDLFTPEKEIRVEAGPILKRESEQAFMAGNQTMARELMFGFMATEYQEALVPLRTVKYSRLLQRPVWNIRWGVSISIRGDDISDPKPIKQGATPRRIASRGRGSRGGGGGYGDEGYGGGGGYDESMAEEYGGGMEEEYGGGMEEEYGDDYGAEMQAQMGGGRGRGPGGRPAARAPEAPKIPERKMLSDEASEKLDKNLGLVATVLSEEFNKRFQRGDFGPGFATLTQSPDLEDDDADSPAPARPLTPQGPMSGALNEALLDTGNPAYPMWQPGIVFLGEGYSDEILPIAARAGIDLVLHIDVILKSGRNDDVQNISRCRLFQVSPKPDSSGRKRQQLVTSKGMDSYEAGQFASAGRMDEREYVEEQLSSVFTIIDRDIKVIDLPQLPAASAKKRIASVMSGARAKSLRTLAEIRLFQARDLISPEDVEAAFDIVGGSEGLILLHGPTHERIETARQWATEATAAIEAN